MKVLNPGMAALLVFLSVVATGCAAEVEPAAVEEPTTILPTPAPAAAAVLRRLTRSQYTNAVHDLFGEGVAVPSGLEPDGQAHGMLAAGSAVTSVSPLGTERYADAAGAIAEQILEPCDALFLCR